MLERELERSRVLMVALLALVLLAAAACGGGEQSTTVESTQAPERSYVYEPRPVEPEPTVDTSAVVVPKAEEEAVATGQALPVSWEEAESVFHEGRYSDAMELFSAYVEFHPDNPWGYYMRGLSAWKAGLPSRAEESFGRALELDGTHVKSLRNLTRVLLEQGRPDEALDKVQSALEIEPESGESYRLLGRTRHELGQAEEALQAYRRALLLDGEDTWAMNNLGLILIQQERFEEAEGPLARAAELLPDEATFHNNLGIALERSGHYRASQEAYRTALSLDEGYEKASVSLQRVEGLEEDFETEQVDILTLAQGFVETIEGWRREADVASEPGDVGNEVESFAANELPETEAVDGSSGGEDEGTSEEDSGEVGPVEP